MILRFSKDYLNRDCGGGGLTVSLKLHLNGRDIILFALTCVLQLGNS